MVIRTTLLALVFLAHSIGARAEENPGAGPSRGLAIEAMVQSTGDEALERFANDHLSPAYRSSFGPGELLAHLKGIRTACANADGILAEPADGGATRLRFLKEGKESSLVFRLESEPPKRIVELELEAVPPPGRKRVEVAPITWETLETRLAEEAAAGFAGTVLVARGNRIVLHKGYGLADRERKTPVTTETIFAIGSVPIDFTQAAILKLAESGKLKTSDTIGKFFADVPADKRSMTIDHLMAGRSGLPNFHHEPGVDQDPDLTWIDRATAIRRIMARELLFAPGSGEAHSHSAWVLLAAIVEMVSGQSYGGFLKKNFFEPAGMTRTGNHEDGAKWGDQEFAVGYGGRSVGEPNIPKHWGPTSWLVMGSGGMQSTPHDLFRWLEAIRTGKTLSSASAAKYLAPAVLAGGDDRGFFCLYNQGTPDQVILCTNVHSGPGDHASAVARRLVEMARGAKIEKPAEQR